MTGTSSRGMGNLQGRVTRLEQRHRPRQPGLSSERRKYLTDRAVTGNQEALQELNLHRQRITQAPSSVLRPSQPV